MSEGNGKRIYPSAKARAMRTRIVAPGRLRELIVDALQDPNDRVPDAPTCERLSFVLQAATDMHDFRHPLTRVRRKSTRDSIKYTNMLRSLIVQQQAETATAAAFIDRSKTEGLPVNSLVAIAIEGETSDHEELSKFKAYLDEIDAYLNVRIAAAPNWHDLASQLLTLFRMTMEPSNPGRPYGASNPGPAVRFIQSALRNITGREESLDAIVQALRRSQTRDKQ